MSAIRRVIAANIKAVFWNSVLFAAEHRTPGFELARRAVQGRRAGWMLLVWIGDRELNLFIISRKSLGAMTVVMANSFF